MEYSCASSLENREFHLERVRPDVLRFHFVHEHWTISYGLIFAFQVHRTIVKHFEVCVFRVVVFSVCSLYANLLNQKYIIPLSQHKYYIRQFVACFGPIVGRKKLIRNIVRSWVMMRKSNCYPKMRARCNRAWGRILSAFDLQRT